MKSLTDKYEILGGELGEQKLIDLLLDNRTITEKEPFLHPQWSDNHDPLTMLNMTDVVARLRHALSDNQSIVIFSDFDADGVPGAVILSDFFKKIKYTNYSVYIPNRNTEGFGLNADACQKFIDDGTQLVVTIDCGIANIAEVAQLRAGGVDVIVTDHHLPDQSGLPDALVLDPKQEGCEYPFKDLCGSGVVFKLVQALVQSTEKLGGSSLPIPADWEKTLMDMVGIATICDMVPLTGENRLFAWAGLRMLRLSRRSGLQQILGLGRSNQATLTAQDVAFTIGPRINAASRIGDPMLAFNTLSIAGEGGVVAAGELEKLNRRRKTVVAQAAKAAYKKVDSQPESNVIVVGNTDWQPGIVGLIAGHLAHKYSKPAFVWTRVGDEYRGSVRSAGVCSINQLMNLAPEGTFKSFGGHDAAGGFVCDDRQIHVLNDKLNSVFDQCEQGSVSKKLIDAEISIDDVNKDNWDVIKLLEPYGIGNTAPLFLIKNIEISNVRLFGAEENHLSLSFKTTRGWTVNAVRFNFLDILEVAPESGQSVSLVVAMEMNTYNGSSELRLRIEEIYT